MTMKRLMLFAAALMLAVPVTSHGEEAKQPAAALPKGHPAIPPQKESASIPGKVLKTMDSGGYTYMYVELKGGKKEWVAIPQTKVKVGQKIAFVPGQELKDFKSKTLNRTFDKVIFSLGLVHKGSKSAPGKKKETNVVVPGSKSAAVAAEKIKVEKAKGPNAHTVAEVFALKNALNGKKVVVRGKVVKVAEHIMKMNWLHIQDGTGSPGKNDHDLVVTTTNALPKEGEIVTVTGTLLKDKDFGSGYKYDALVENAEIVK